MGAQNQKLKMALVFGTLPTADEVDQFRLLSEQFDIALVTSQSICGYMMQTSRFQNLRCVPLPEYDENPTYVPGLEKALQEFDVVVVKERVGLYAYQAMKAKWRKNFRLVVWIDNLTAFPADDVARMRTIRNEVTAAADAFIVQTEAARQTLMTEGVPSDRIHNMIPYVEPTAKRNAKNRAKALASLSMSETDYVVAHIGQVECEEGLLELVHAAKAAMEQDASMKRRLKLIFCGIGSLAPVLGDRVTRLGLEGRVAYVAPTRDAYQAILTGADALYLGGYPSRDRVEGDPFRLVSAMVNEIPVIANRSPLVEEYIGKHRFDFCQGSLEGLTDAIMKSCDARALRNDIVKKNAAVAKQRFSEKLAREDMTGVFNTILAERQTMESQPIDRQVAEVESKVAGRQYLEAIDVIESILSSPQVPIHHKANLYRLIGDSLTKLGDPEAGKGAYTKAIELDPYSARAYIGLGTVGLTKNAFDVSVLHFQKAVSLAPDDEMANLGLGLAFEGLGENDEASHWMVKSLECNPNNTAAIFSLVKLSYKRDRFSEVESALRQYVTSHPTDHNMKYTLAGILFKTGSATETASLMKDILARDPQDARAQALLAQATQTQTGAASNNR